MKFDLSKIYEFNWGELYYTELENELGIDAFRKLNTNQEQSLLQTRQDFKKMIKEDETLNSLEPEHQGSYYSQIFEREEWTIKELQRQQRYAIVLSIFSFFEGRMKHICDLIESRFEFKIKLSDLNNNEDLMRYWNYLEKVYEIENKSLETFFTPIKQQKIIRNVIAHQDGIIREGQIKKVKMVDGINIREIGEKRQIDLGENLYVIYLLNKIEAFFKEVLLLIDKRYKEKTLHNRT